MARDEQESSSDGSYPPPFEYILQQLLLGPIHHRDEALHRVYELIIQRILRIASVSDGRSALVDEQAQHVEIVEGAIDVQRILSTWGAVF